MTQRFGIDLVYLILLGAMVFSQTVRAQDTLYTREGKRIIGFGTRVRTFDVTYRRAADSTSKIMNAHRVYLIHFADGTTWPKNSATREARLSKYVAAHQPASPKPKQDRSDSRHRLLACAPGLHQTGDFPGISIGLAYEGFVGPKGLFSVSSALTRMWAGTNEAGRLGNGDHRTNINANYIVPAFRYHPIGRKFDLDPFIDVGAAVGTYRRSAIWMLQSHYYSDRPVTDLLLAPQLEIGLNVNPGPTSRLCMQVLGASGPQLIGGRSAGLLSTVGLIRVGLRL